MTREAIGRHFVQHEDEVVTMGADKGHAPFQFLAPYRAEGRTEGIMGA